ncbi:hypothetical protein PRIPAC_90461 [Pristionchus pacificus]|uniref:Uncharacterized protein n=1 Tax=Pristionchus pacificus TaxID=54126 RepID=A0A2A6B8C7_PRIPA|nr:hypothetical protein PRIPAC_90461 [Pristionchus pacificus]|eukprot:PDM62140.1 hypothetical protein PRIPAC_51582 [Pristionchus pacificus]
MNEAERFVMNSRRVSLPCTLRSPLLSPRVCHLAPLPLDESLNHLSPTSPSSLRRSLPSTPRRSLPSTPRTLSPRADSSRNSSPRAPRHINNLPDVMEYSQMDRFPPAMKKRHKMSSEGASMRSFDCTSRGVITREVAVEEEKMSGGRRSTCPDIYLYSPEGRNPTRRVLLRVYGSSQSGKRRVADAIYQQVMDASDDDTERTRGMCRFLLNGEEVQMEVLVESTLETDMTPSETVYAVVYRVDSRESLAYALRFISRLPKNEAGQRPPSLLIGNKCDNQRSRVVSNLEGRTLSKLYKIPFVEISALMSVNTDLLWESIVRLLSPRPQTTSFLGRVIASCEQMVRNALSFSPTPNRSIDGDSHEDSRGSRSMSSREPSPSRLS